MKQFVILLGILSLYRLVDMALTVQGLALGLTEANPLVCIDNPLLHYVVHSVITTAFSFTAYLLEMRLGMKNIMRTTILLMAIFYVYVLIHNLVLIWEVL